MGDGCNIKFWSDQWIPDLPNFKLSSIVPIEAMTDNLVGEIIFNHSWELSAIEPWLESHEVDAIVSPQR